MLYIYIVLDIIMSIGSHHGVFILSDGDSLTPVVKALFRLVRDLCSVSSQNYQRFQFIYLIRVS